MLCFSCIDKEDDKITLFPEVIFLTRSSTVPQCHRQYNMTTPYLYTAVRIQQNKLWRSTKHDYYSFLLKLCQSGCSFYWRDIFISHQRCLISFKSGFWLDSVKLHVGVHAVFTEERLPSYHSSIKLKYSAVMVHLLQLFVIATQHFCVLIRPMVQFLDMYPTKDFYMLGAIRHQALGSALAVLVFHPFSDIWRQFFSPHSFVFTLSVD